MKNNIQYFNDQNTLFLKMFKDIDELFITRLENTTKSINILLTGGKSLAKILNHICQIEKKYNINDLKIRIWLTDERVCPKDEFKSNFLVCRQVLSKNKNSKLRIIKWNYFGENFLSLFISSYLNLFKYKLLTFKNSIIFSILTVGQDGHFAGYWQKGRNYFTAGGLIIFTFNAPLICSRRISFSNKIISRIQNNFLYLNNIDKVKVFDNLKNDLLTIDNIKQIYKVRL